MGRIELRRLVFTSANIDVIAVECAGSTTVVVTFDSFSDGENQTRKGFGEAYFEKIGITAYHFIHKQNLWYSFPEMVEALELVRGQIPAEHPIITYGASMGGYAAFRSSGLLQARKVIAFSPQYSIDPVLAPWETRWIKATQNCTHIMDSLPINPLCEIYLFYDPETKDARHAELIGQHGPSHHIQVPYSGHSSIAMLQQIGMLDSALTHIIGSEFDERAFQTAIESKSSQSAHFLVSLADSMPYRQKKQRLALLYRAIELAEKEPEYYHHLGKTLVSYGLWSEAKAIYYRGWEQKPDSHLGLLSYLSFLNLSRRYSESRVVYDKIVAQAPDFVDAVGLKREKFDRHPFSSSRFFRTLRSIRGFCTPICIW